MTTAKLQVVIALFNEPFADETVLVLRDASLINVIVLCLHFEVHLLDLFEFESFSGRGFGGSSSTDSSSSAATLAWEAAFSAVFNWGSRFRGSMCCPLINLVCDSVTF